MPKTAHTNITHLVSRGVFGHGDEVETIRLKGTHGLCHLP